MASLAIVRKINAQVGIASSLHRFYNTFKKMEPSYGFHISWFVRCWLRS
jgi:hypothetical protein